jgi:hypothetical protein
VALAVEAPDTDADVLLRLTDPHGNELLVSDVFYSGEIDPQREQLEALLVADGSYTIEVEWRSATVVPYALTTRRVTPEPVTIGQTLEVAPEQPFWRFEGHEGEQLTITADPLEGGDIYLQLFDDQYQLLTEASSTFDSPAAQVSTVLTRDGPHFIRLGWFFNPARATLTTAAAEPALLEPGDEQQAAADQNLWRYSGRPGEIVTFAVEAQDNTDIWLRLRDEAFAELDYDDFYSGGITPQLSYRLPDEGALLVEVGWYNTPAPYRISATTVDPQPLTIGEPIPEAGPDGRFWVVEGRAGDLVVFAAQALEGDDPSLILRDASFNVLARNENFSGVYNPQIAYLLPEDGPYYVEVGWNDIPGPYALSATVAEPERLPIERTVAADAGSLWTFRGEQGDFVEIGIEAPEDSFNWLRLLDAQFVELSYAEEGDSRQNPQITYLLPADGVYAIEVGSNDAPAPYSLRVTRIAPVTLPLDESVPAGNAGRTAWAFAGRAGDIVSAAVDALDDGDTRLTLFDAQYNVLADSDDFDDLNPQIIARLPADGMYILDMGWQDWTGLEDLTVVIAPRFGPYRLTAAVLEPEPLAAGETITEATADRRLWRIAGRAGDRLTLAAAALSGGDNLWLRLLDEQFAPVAFNDNADGLDPRLSLELPETGDYYLEVGWFGETGTYRLTAESE